MQLHYPTHFRVTTLKWPFLVFRQFVLLALKSLAQPELGYSYVIKLRNLRAQETDSN